MADSLLAILVSGVAALYQVSGGRACATLPPDASAVVLSGLVASGDVDLMAAYEQALSVTPTGGNYAVGCIESAKSNVGVDSKKAFLVAAGNLSKRRHLAISGKEGLIGSGLYNEATERSVSRLGPVRESERMVFATPNATISCVLIREGHQ